MRELREAVAHAQAALTLEEHIAEVADKLATIDGPDLYWEEKGPMQNPPLEESDFKEYDKYSTFVAACNSHGIDLNQGDLKAVAAKSVEDCCGICGGGRAARGAV